MNQLKWIQTSLLLTALLQFAAAARYKDVTFRVGEDATLPCEAVIPDQQKCEYTTWLFTSGNPAVELVKLGRVRNSDVRSDRLRVTEDCSLVIKKITEEDDGRYDCQQYKGEGEPKTDEDSIVRVFVTESEDPRPPTRPPTTRPPPRPPIRPPPTRPPPRPTTRPPTRPPTKPPTTRPPPRPTTTTRPPTTSPPPRPTTRPPTTSPPPRPPTRPPTRPSPPTPNPAPAGDLKWLFVLVPVVVFTALFVVIMNVIRQKGNRTQTSDDVELTSDPAGSRSAAGTNQDTADPEGGVSYASIRYNKKGRSKAHVCGDDDGSVTYASVKPASSSAAAGASADPSSLYATINKPKK